MKKMLTRYRIDDLAAELNSNMVCVSRRDYIERFFKKHLGDGPYYCISSYNEGQKEITVSGTTDRMKRNYKCYVGTSHYSMRSSIGTIEGHEFPVIIQEICPKTVQEFYDFDKYTVYYVNARFLDGIELA